jgi:hypothetical protein
MAAAPQDDTKEEERGNDWRVLTACVRGFHATLDLVLAKKAEVTASVVRLIEHDAPVRQSAGFIFHGTCEGDIVHTRRVNTRCRQCSVEAGHA